MLASEALKAYREFLSICSNSLDSDDSVIVYKKTKELKESIESKLFERSGDGFFSYCEIMNEMASIMSHMEYFREGIDQETYVDYALVHYLDNYFKKNKNVKDFEIADIEFKK